MPIIKKEQSIPPRPVVILIYGRPGCGKSSLANTAKNPIIIDCDRGADRAINRQDYLSCSRWEDVLNEKETIKQYDTIVIDTCRALLDDFLMDYVRRMDKFLITNQLKAYGAIANEFKAFVSELRAAGKDLIFISHTREDKDGDITQFSPDVTGSSKELLLRMADQVGFVAMVNNKRTVMFEPDDRIIAKNVAKLPAFNIPNADTAEFVTAMQDIIEKTKSSIIKRSEAQSAAIKSLMDITNSIASVSSAESATEILKKINKLPAAHKKIKQLELLNKTKELGYQYDKEKGVFVNETN